MPLVVSTAQHIGTRAEQQDAARVREAVPGFPTGTLVAIVADGMGGHVGGAEASRIAADVFAGAVARTSHAEPAADVLHRATGEAGRAVHAAARAAGVEDDMGTTLVAALVEPERFVWISVGDSAVYRLAKGGLTRLSTPHTLGTRLDRAVAEGRVSAEDAAANRQRAALTSFLGQASLSEIDGAVEPVALGEGEAVLLCSDGLFGTVGDDEIRAVLAAVVPEAAAQALVDAALSHGRARQDNITALVVTRVGADATAAVAPGIAAPVAARAPAWRPLAWIAALVVLAAAALWAWPQLRPGASPPAADSTATSAARRDSLALAARRDSAAAVPDSLRAIPAITDSLSPRPAPGAAPALPGAPAPIPGASPADSLNARRPAPRTTGATPDASPRLVPAGVPPVRAARMGAPARLAAEGAL